MAKKPSPQLMKMVKQILLLAVPLILKALKNRIAKADSNAHKNGRAATRPPQSTRQGTPTPKAKKRKNTGPLPETPPRQDTTHPRAKHKPSPIADLHRKQRSDVIITDAGVIVKVLPDDNIGSRHQRFLVEVDHTDITIKIAHNIDLAPRVPAREGDRLTFKGEYEYNDLGGALHWTHHDPKKWRPGGWIDHAGQRYE